MKPLIKDDETARKSASILGRLRELDVQPSPYMKTRILALHRERKKKSSWLFFWKTLAVGSGLVSAGLLVVLISNPFGNSQAHFGAVVDRQIAIRLDLSAESPQVAFVEVELPDGVHFYSKSFPEFANQRMLTLNRPSGTTQSLPIVVQSNQTGIKDVVVRFMGNDKHVIAVRNLKIRFEKRSV